MGGLAVVLTSGNSSSSSSSSNSDSPSSSPGTGVISMTNIIGIGAGAMHTCAIKSASSNAGALFCWGSNDKGQLGTGTASQQPLSTPQAVPSLNGADDASKVMQVAGGETHSCAINLEGAVFCWGNNQAGQ